MPDSTSGLRSRMTTVPSNGMPEADSSPVRQPLDTCSLRGANAAPGFPEAALSVECRPIRCERPNMGPAGREKSRKPWSFRRASSKDSSRCRKPRTI